MTGKNQEKRKYERYKTDLEIYFDFVYDLETKVKFELIDKEEEKVLSEKYSAISRNVSVGGLCFAAHEKVNQGDLLHLEVYLPSAEDPVHMRGEVEWCKPVSASHGDPASKEKKDRLAFEVGVKLVSVNKELVRESIYHDEVYDVDWSVVLESIFGNYRLLMEGEYKPQVE